MAVIASPNASSLKLKFDQGTDLNGESIIKTRTYSNVKATALNDDIITVVNALSALQQHTVIAVNRVDNSSLSE